MRPCTPYTTSMPSQPNPKAAPAVEAPRRRWQAPQVSELPRLTELTLQTGDAIPGGGNTGGGGSTVF
jgi:hypothetical protein